MQVATDKSFQRHAPQRREIANRIAHARQGQLRKSHSASGERSTSLPLEPLGTKKFNFFQSLEGSHRRDIGDCRVLIAKLVTTPFSTTGGSLPVPSNSLPSKPGLSSISLIATASICLSAGSSAV